MAGYSGTPLTSKLGIKEGMDIAILHEPANYRKTLGTIPHGVEIDTSLTKGTYELIHVFVMHRKELEETIGAIIKHLSQNGMIWISWPKKSANMETDLHEQILRDVCLPEGIVDVKVCAIDETWSGLKFMIRKELRKN